MPALLTRACRTPPSASRRHFVSSTARMVSAGLERSICRWSSGPISQGQFSGKAWREQVITRQPAAENRFTVACPIPRLAPVRSMIRRGVLEEGIDHRCGRAKPSAAVALGPRGEFLEYGYRGE